MPYKDPENQKAYLAKHYRANKDKYYGASQKAREQRKDLVREAKNKPCADCGILYPYYVMQFDHMGNKSFGISGKAQQGGYGSLENLINEISKCEVVCANCHAERTYNRNN